MTATRSSVVESLCPAFFKKALQLVFFDFVANFLHRLPIILIFQPQTFLYQISVFLY